MRSIRALGERPRPNDPDAAVPAAARVRAPDVRAEGRDSLRARPRGPLAPVAFARAKVCGVEYFHGALFSFLQPSSANEIRVHVTVASRALSGRRAHATARRARERPREDRTRPPRDFTMNALVAPSTTRARRGRAETIVDRDGVRVRLLRLLLPLLLGRPRPPRRPERRRARGDPRERLRRDARRARGRR